MDKKFFNLLIVTLTAISFFSKGYANTAKDQVNFQEIFNLWTHAFNEKKLPTVCDLFSKTIIAEYQGSPRKNYSKICDGFQKIFQEKDTIYHNAFKIHQIYRSKDLAAVRITWYLDTYKKGAHISSTQEEGLDIFQKQANKKWQIVNFIAYPISSGK